MSAFSGGMEGYLVLLSPFFAVRSAFLGFIPLLDSLIERLQHPGVHGGDHVHRRIQFFLGHARFPCVRKAAVHSRIAEPHHRDRQTHQHLLPIGEAGHRMGIPVKLSKVSFVHSKLPLAANKFLKSLVRDLFRLQDVIIIRATGCSKRSQRRGARRSMSGGVLFSYVDAKSGKRNEAYGSFSAACYGLTPQIRAYENPPFTCT